MIKVYTNSLGSGDWITVRSGDKTLHEDHRIYPLDLVSILHSLGFQASLVEITDEQMEEGDFQ